MTVDCFLYAWEDEILEIRLRELWDVVDRFVLVESPYTFRGGPKPLHFAENIDRFRPCLSKIEHVIANDMPTGDDPWARENRQREYFVRGLHGCSDSDVVMVSDVDEIFRPDLPARYPGSGVYRVAMQQYRYFINYRDPHPWDNPRICTVGDLRRCTDPHGIRYVYPGDGVLDNGGWHFTYLGGRETVLHKVRNFSHYRDKGTPEFLAKIEGGMDWREIDSWLEPVAIDETFPKAVREREAELREKGLAATSVTC